MSVGLQKEKRGMDVVIEIALLLILVLLVAYSLAYKMPIFYNMAGPAHLAVPLPANLTSNGGLNQSISELNSLPGP